MNFLFVISTFCVVGVMFAVPLARIVAPRLARRA